MTEHPDAYHRYHESPICCIWVFERVNVKLAEDILNPLGITTPYVADGGNLTLEFTIQAADVHGAAQVFPSSFAFGTVPLEVTQ